MGEHYRVSRVFPTNCPVGKKELPGWRIRSVHKLDKNGEGRCAQLQLSDINNLKYDLFGFKGKNATSLNMIGTCFQYARGGGKFLIEETHCQRVGANND